MEEGRIEMRRAVFEDGVWSPTQDETDGLEPEVGEFRGAREDLGVDVELTEAMDDAGQGLISTVTYRSDSIIDWTASNCRD